MRPFHDGQTRFSKLAFAVVFVAMLLGLQAHAVTINWTPVGNPGAANDVADGDSKTPGVQHYGWVNYNYNIDKYDVTNAQYVEFLNSKDPNGANTLGLYSTYMTSQIPFGGIDYNANADPGAKYSAKSGDENHPVDFLSLFSTLRFANWLNNGGTSSSDTESGAYTLLGGTPTPSNAFTITRTPGATIFLPSEDEWYKSAFYDPRTTAQGGPPSDSHYWLYGTSSNDPPVFSNPSPLANHANYLDFVRVFTNVAHIRGRRARRVRLTWRATSGNSMNLRSAPITESEAAIFSQLPKASCRHFGLMATHHLRF